MVLPSDYQFGDPTITQDFRLTKVFTFKERYKLSILGEIFNAFNIANLTYPGGAFTLDTKSANPAAQAFAFGQPTQRINQTFCSGGARATTGGRAVYVLTIDAIGFSAGRASLRSTAVKASSWRSRRTF